MTRLRREPASWTLGAFALCASFSLLAGAALARLGDLDDQLKAVALLVAISAVAVAVLKPRVGLAMVLALVPFGTAATVVGLVVGTNEVLVAAVAVAVLPRVRPSMVPRPVLFGFGLLVVGGMISAVFAEQPPLALWGAVRWLFVALLVFGAFSLVDEPRYRAIAADIVSISAIVVAGCALLQMAGFYAFVQEPYLDDRVDSTFGYYTQFAGFMAIAALIAANGAANAIDRHAHGRAALHMAAATAGCLGIGVSLSRGGFLALVVGLAWLALLNLARIERLLRITMVLVTIAVMGFFITPTESRSTLLDRVQNPALSRGGDTQREELQDLGTAALRQNPFGIGYANFPAYLERAQHSSGLDETFFHAHRTPTQIGLDAGWPGLVGFLGLVLMSLLHSIRRSRGVGTSADLISAGFSAGLIGLMAQGLFDYLFYELSFAVVFGMLVWGSWSGFRRTPSVAEQ